MTAAVPLQSSWRMTGGRQVVTIKHEGVQYGSFCLYAHMKSLQFNGTVRDVEKWVLVKLL